MAAPIGTIYSLELRLTYILMMENINGPQGVFQE